MKTSELISHLNQILAEHGDIEVAVYDGYSYWYGELTGAPEVMEGKRHYDAIITLDDLDRGGRHRFMDDYQREIEARPTVKFLGIG